jgi:hypothetical protein
VFEPGLACCSALQASPFTPAMFMAAEKSSKDEDVSRIGGGAPLGRET